MIKHEEAETLSAGGRAWQLVYDLLNASKPFMNTALAGFDVTPMQGWVLKILSARTPMPMSELAEHLGCDASNVTSIVDRLESRGYVQRRPAADRRVKELSLTPEGVELFIQIDAHMKKNPPPMIEQLPEADKRQLCEILQRAVDSVQS